MTLSPSLQRTSSPARRVGSGSAVRETCRLTSCTTAVGAWGKWTPWWRRGTARTAAMSPLASAPSHNATWASAVPMPWRCTCSHTTVSLRQIQVRVWVHKSKLYNNNNNINTFNITFIFIETLSTQYRIMSQCIEKALTVLSMKVRKVWRSNRTVCRK